MSPRVQQVGRRAARALAAAQGGGEDLGARIRALRKRQNRIAARLQRRIDALEAEVRTRDDELAARILASAAPARDDQADVLHRISLHEDWLRAVRPEGVRVSVVVTTRHRPELLRRALLSLVAQTYDDWEGVVVDDSDPDRAAQVRDVVAQLADPRIRLVPLHGGLGPGAARNAGLEAVTGELVAYLDDDNVMFPVWLAALVDASRTHPTAPLWYGARVTRDVDGQRVHLDAFDRRLLERKNLIDTGQIGHRADPGLRWEARLPRLGDWDLVLRLTDDEPGVPVLARAVGYTTDAPDRLTLTGEYEDSATRVRAAARSRRPLHVLAVNAQFPLLSETYVADELAALTAQGARLGFVRINKPVAPMRVDGPVWTDLATGVRELDPDVIVMHWVGVANRLGDQLAELGIPYAVRSHGFDTNRDLVEKVLADPLCLGVWAYPTATQGFPGTHALPLLLTSHDRIPAPEPGRARDLVLSSSAGLPKKDFDLLFAAMDQLPGIERRIVVAATERFEQLPGDLFERCGDRADPPLVQVNLPRDDVFALLGRTALHVYTLRPEDPFGMPMSVAEALCAGASVCLPDRPEARAYAGPGARFYSTADDIARHAREVLTDSPEVQEERAANRRWALERFCDPALGRRFSDELRAALARHRGDPVAEELPQPKEVLLPDRNGTSRGSADLSV